MTPREVRKSHESMARRGSDTLGRGTLRKLHYEKQHGLCAAPDCGSPLQAGEYDLDHKTPISAGGRDTLENTWLLCRDCHRAKTRMEQHGYDFFGAGTR